jgi:tRNA:m(5)U-54 methyltransferase
MRPIGLKDPRTGKRPIAVVQLRQDNIAGTLYNLVGFQTNLTFSEQKRVFRLIPAWKMPALNVTGKCTATPSSTLPYY